MTSRPQVITLVLENRLTDLLTSFSSSSPLAGGVCGPEDADLFFSDFEEEIALALELCAMCPIRELCLKSALVANEEGIWGGTTNLQREQMQASTVGQALPDLETATAELQIIMGSNATEVAQKYHVERRTVHRWRHAIQANDFASSLLRVS